MPIPSEVQGILAVFVCGCFVTLNLILSKLLQGWQWPYFFLAGLCSLLIVLGLQVVMLARQGMAAYHCQRKEIKWVLSRGFFGCGNNVLSVCAALAGAPMGSIGVLCSVNTVVAALLGRVVLGEPLGKLHMLSVLCRRRNWAWCLLGLWPCTAIRGLTRLHVHQRAEVQICFSHGAYYISHVFSLCGLLDFGMRSSSQQRQAADSGRLPRLCHLTLRRPAHRLTCLQPDVKRRLAAVPCCHQRNGDDCDQHEHGLRSRHPPLPQDSEPDDHPRSCDDAAGGGDSGRGKVAAPKFGAECRRTRAGSNEQIHD
ncbi:NLRC5 [Symbiodinium sp. CCMP2456]|nr:NLRC5 [Symbiodinium sp. CCMP2456]